MKTTIIFLILFLTRLDLWAQLPPASLVTNLPGAMRLPGRFGTTNSPAAMRDFAARVAAIRSNSAAMTLPATPASIPAAPATPIPAAVQPNANAPDNSNSSGGTNEVAAYSYTYQSVTIDQLLEVYSQQLVGRTLLRAPGLNTTATVVLKTVTPLTKSEAIQVFQSLLSLNGIVVQNVGDKFVKVLPADQAGGGGQKPDTSDASQLPELGTYVTHIVHLNYVKPSAMQTILTPFAKLPGAITPLEDNGILILRDNAENVKRMLELIAQVDTGGGESEIISEVIPIRYALAGDIANALNSLGGGSGGTVSIGSAAGTSATGNGFARPTGTTSAPGGGYQPGGNGLQGGQSRTMGGIGSTPNGTPAGGAGTFQSRLLSIVNNAAQGSGKQDQIQLFGQTKIIADNRSNSLLIFATRQDMDAITNVIAKLDVLLSQVLIESVIIDVDLNKSLNAGVSVAQNPEIYSPAQGIAGGGGSVNGPTFINFLASNSTYSNGTNSSAILGNALSSGLSYFGNIGPTWDVALQAAAVDSSATVIQRPRIQTSQAKAASFFVGETVPYVTGSTYGSAYGNSSSYSQLSVGVELDVTPFINPDGLVVMDINQEIDDLDGFTPIENVGNVPNTTKRTLQSEIAVKDKDTIMLGGFVRSDKSKNKSGVPYLQDIPLIGNLFTSRTDSKDRKETIVLIRPTVLRSPDDAAMQAVTEKKRLPGITAAINEDSRDERKQVEAEADAEAKAEAADAEAAQKHAKQKTGDNSGVFLPVLPDGTVDTNAVEQPNP
jgi:general secretion pathway protein D